MKTNLEKDGTKGEDEKVPSSSKEEDKKEGNTHPLTMNRKHNKRVRH